MFLCAEVIIHLRHRIVNENESQYDLEAIKRRYDPDQSGGGKRAPLHLNFHRTGLQDNLSCLPFLSFQTPKDRSDRHVSVFKKQELFK